MLDPEKRNDPFYRLTVLKGYQTEIPEEMIHSNSPDNKYKARRGWFVGVAWDFETIIEEKLVDDPKLVKLFQGFRRWLDLFYFSGRPTRPRDIAITDRVIDRILNARQ